MFSTTKCAHCQKVGFEVVEEELNNSPYKLTMIRCKSCKTAIGAMDYYNIGSLLQKLAKRLNINLND